MQNILIQAIGGVAYLLLVGSYYRKTKLQILLMQIFALIVFSIHYHYLNGTTGALCNFISAMMMFLIYLFEKKEKSKTGLILILIPSMVIISLLSWENIYSIFPIIASIIMLFAFLLKNEHHIRIIGFISNVLWTIYGVIYRSYSTMIFEFFSIIGTFVAIIKNRKNTKNF